MHDFAGKYQYTAGTNQLTSVTGYKSYTYNAIGQMTEEISVEGSQGAAFRKLTYDVTGKVTEVRDENDQLIAKYTYDDKGFRVSKESYEAGSLVKTTYERYEGSALTAKEFPLYGANHLGMFQTGQVGLPPSTEPLVYDKDDRIQEVSTSMKAPEN